MRSSQYKILLALFLISLLIRLGAFFQTPVINDDGPLYIYQAEAIASGKWDKVNSCGFPYLSLYPFLILIVHTFVNDWSVAAQSVSILFGSLSLIPLFLIVRRFFNIKISVLTTLVFALNPLLVDTSVDIVKDPPAWFFSLTGLYLFIRFFDKKDFYFLTLSSIALFIAILFRIDMSFYLVGSFIYLLFFEKERKLFSILYFTSPFLIIILVSILGIVITKNFDFSLVQSYVIPRVQQAFNLTRSYSIIASKLDSLTTTEIYYITGVFFSQMKDALLFIPFLIIALKMIKTFFLPFFLIYVIGCITAARTEKKHLLTYFALLSLVCLILLYCSYLLIWVISKRYIVVFLFTAIPFVGYGIMKIVESFSSSKLKKVTVISLFIIVFSITAVKDLKPARKSKLIFKEIGTYISDRENAHDDEIKIVSSEGLILFYANEQRKGAACPRSLIDYKSIVKGRPEEIIELFKEKNIAYFLYEEKKMRKSSLSIEHLNNFEKMKQWNDKKRGTFILYKLL